MSISRELNRFFTEDVLMRAMPELDGPEMPVIDLLRAAAASAAHRFEEQPVVGVSIAGTLMEVFERLGASAEADEQLARATPFANALSAGDPQRLLFDTQRAAVHGWRGQWPEAEEAFRDVLARLERAPVPLPVVEEEAGDTDRARELFDAAIGVYERAEGDHAADAARARAPGRLGGVTYTRQDPCAGAGVGSR